MLARAVPVLQLPDGWVHQIVQPDCDRRWDHFSIFLLQPALDVVVAFTFVRLQPELSGNFHLRFYPQMVDLNVSHFFADVAQRIA